MFKFGALLVIVFNLVLVVGVLFLVGSIGISGLRAATNKCNKDTVYGIERVGLQSDWFCERSNKLKGR